MESATTLRHKRIRPLNLVSAVAAALGLLVMTATAYCDTPTTMAPPLQPGAAQPADAAGSAGGDTSQDSVFQWTEVPQNQQVPITRAVFDQSGYQLYDTAGETIVIPFTNDNLYVMKFAQSPDGTMYFVNDGDAPVLYLPQNGYLENADVAGARWYPFSQDFHPADPVFLGVAPSWHAFLNIGWYPGIVFHGGYWSHTPYIAGGILTPSIGFSIIFGGHSFHGWAPYHSYIGAHPAPYHDWGGGPHPGPHAFRGAIGSGHAYQAGPQARSGFGEHGYSGGHRVFRGVRNDRHDGHRDDNRH